MEDLIITKKIRLIIINLIVLTSINVFAFENEFNYNDIKIKFKLNDAWTIDKKINWSTEKPHLYSYKRKAIYNKNNMGIIPYISFVLETTDTEADIIMYSTFKRGQYSLNKIEKIKTQEDGSTTVKNAIIFDTSYDDKNNIKHKIILFFSIQNKNGIQIIFDTTYDTYKNIETEVWEFFKSLIIQPDKVKPYYTVDKIKTKIDLNKVKEIKKNPTELLYIIWNIVYYYNKYDLNNLKRYYHTDDVMHKASINDIKKIWEIKNRPKWKITHKITYDNFVFFYGYYMDKKKKIIDVWTFSKHNNVWKCNLYNERVEVISDFENALFNDEIKF